MVGPRRLGIWGCAVVARARTAQQLGQTRWANARWLVLAPHADDETLGAGALIVDAASRQALAGVVFVTNGAGSHAHYSAAQESRLVNTRRHEGDLALRRLGGARQKPPVFLGWPDARPFSTHQPEFGEAARKLAALCIQRSVDAIAVTAAHEPHCDHVAACNLAYAAAERASRAVTVFEYVVWADRPPGSRFSAIRTPSMPRGQRRSALAAHRSQLTPLLGKGFRLPVHQLDMNAFDVLYTRRRHGL